MMVFTKSVARSLTSLLGGVALLLTGCGGGGSGNNDNGAADNPATALALEVFFPPPNASFRGAPEIVVSGVLIDEVDGQLDPGDIVEFDVNGVSPTVDLNNGRWSATLPATTTETPIEIVARVYDSADNESTVTLSVGNTPVLPDYTYLAMLPESESLLVYGSSTLRRLDLATGEEQPIIENFDVDSPLTGIRVDADSDQTFLLLDNFSYPFAASVSLGEGQLQELGRLPSSVNSTHIPDHTYPDFDVSGTRFAYSFQSDSTCSAGVLDINSGQRLDLLNNDRWEIDAGKRTYNFCPGALVLDPRGNQAVIAPVRTPENTFVGLYALDLSTGDRSTLSGDDKGTGPRLDTVDRLFTRGAGEAVIALNTEGVFSVELDSGDRELLLAEPDLPKDVTGIVYDEPMNRLLMAHAGRTLSSLDLTSGEKNILLTSSNSVGVGPGVEANSPTVLDTKRNRLLVLETNSESLIEIDLDTLQRRTLVENLKPVASWTSVLLDTGADIIYYHNYFGREILSLDLETGVERVVTSNSNRANPELSSISGMCLDSERELLYLAGEYVLYPPLYYPWKYFTGILSVDTVTGERRIMSSEDQMPPELVGQDLDAVLCDTENDRLLVMTETGSILAVEPSTGERQTLVTRFDSNGGIYPDGFVWDSVADHVLIRVYKNYGTVRNEIQSVNLVTGESELVAQGLTTWVYDSQGELLYSSDDALSSEELGNFFVIDRASGAKATIAYP